MAQKSWLVVLFGVMVIVNPAIGQEMTDEEYCSQEAVELEVPEDEREDYITQCVESLIPQNDTAEVDQDE